MTRKHFLGDLIQQLKESQLDTIIRRQMGAMIPEARTMETLTKIAEIEISGQVFDLARRSDGDYTLVKISQDVYGNPTGVEIEELSHVKARGLLNLLGETMEALRTHRDRVIGKNGE